MRISFHQWLLDTYQIRKHITMGFYEHRDIIEQVIEKHGGIDPLKTFKNNDDLYKHYSRQSKLERILG